MGIFKNFRFSLPIMFCAIAIIGVIVALTKTIKQDLAEANRPTLHVYAVCYYSPNQDRPPSLNRIIYYEVHFPGHPSQRTDRYVDDCTDVEPGFLNKVFPGGSATTYIAIEPGLFGNPTTINSPMITGRMQANFGLLKIYIADHYDMRQIHWRPDSSGAKIFSLDLKLPGHFATAEP